MSRYKSTRLTRKTTNRKNVKQSVKSYATTIYSNIPERNDDMFVIATEGDRLDNLAFQFYGNPDLWWYIAKANNISAMNVPAGTSLRIPATTTYA